MYTTVKGKTYERITPKLWRGIKRVAMKRFDGSRDLFDACWREYRKALHDTDDPTCIDDVVNWLDNIASEKVNNPKSSFWLHG